MTEKKIAVIGGGGKITTAVILELLYGDAETPYRFSLFGRTEQKMVNTQTLASRFNAGNGRLEIAPTLEAALEGAALVLYCASYGLAPFEEYRAFGVQHGAYLMGIGERMTKLCPDAWLLVVTNPPDIPLAAVRLRFGLERVVGLCNASTFTQKVLAAFLDEDEEEVWPMDVGVNHELWYYDVLLREKSVYESLKPLLLAQYDPALIVDDFHEQFPEWREGFLANLAILRETGFLHGPVGGCHRFRNLPKTRMSELMRRPNYADFERLLDPALTREQILRGTRRCAAEFPVYIARIVRSILRDEGARASALVLNRGALPHYPEDAMVQLTCRFNADGIVRPVPELPEFIEASLAPRIRQNLLLARALAEQDETYLKQAALVFPERVDFAEVLPPFPEDGNAEPWMSLN